MPYVLGIALWILCAVFALRGHRWAYAIFIVLAFVWIPARTGFRLHWPPCDLRITLDLALDSLVKYKHVFLFGMFFLMTWVQLRNTPYARVWAALATVAAGVLVELEEGATGTGHCRLTDLGPDCEGALIGAVIAGLWRRGLVSSS